MKKSILAVLAVVLLTPAVAGARGEFTIDPVDTLDPSDPGAIETAEQTCSALFGNRLDVRCCIKHVLAGEKPEACPLPPPPPETQPGGDPEPVPSPKPSPKPSEDACASIGDPALKDCCETHGGLTLEAVKECIPDSDDPSDACNVVVNVDGDVNGQMNVCCQYVNNAGVIQDAGVVQECENAFQGGSETKPEAPIETPAIVSGETEETAAPGAFAKGGCSLGSDSSGGTVPVEFVLMGLVSAIFSIFRSRKISHV